MDVHFVDQWSGGGCVEFCSVRNSQTPVKESRFIMTSVSSILYDRAVDGRMVSVKCKLSRSFPWDSEILGGLWKWNVNGLMRGAVVWGVKKTVMRWWP